MHLPEMFMIFPFTQCGFGYMDLVLFAAAVASLFFIRLSWMIYLFSLSTEFISMKLCCDFIFIYSIYCGCCYCKIDFRILAICVMLSIFFITMWCVIKQLMRRYCSSVCVWLKCHLVYMKKRGKSENMYSGSIFS